MSPTPGPSVSPQEEDDDGPPVGRWSSTEVEPVPTQRKKKGSGTAVSAMAASVSEQMEEIKTVRTNVLQYYKV